MFLRAFATTLIEIVAGDRHRLDARHRAWHRSPGSSRRLAAATAPVLSSLFAIPLIIIYPLLMAWLGIGPVSKVVFGVLSGFFPIALNTIDGVRAIEPRYLVFARSVGATTLQTYARIVFPLALPVDRVGAARRHRPRRHRRDRDRDARLARRHRLSDLVSPHAVQHRPRLFRHRARAAAGGRGQCRAHPARTAGRDSGASASRRRRHSGHVDGRGRYRRNLHRPGRVRAGLGRAAHHQGAVGAGRPVRPR